MIGAIVIAVGTVATIWTIAASVYWIVRPGEHQLDHPKRSILRVDR